MQIACNPDPSIRQPNLQARHQDLKEQIDQVLDSRPEASYDYRFLAAWESNAFS